MVNSWTEEFLRVAGGGTLNSWHQSLVSCYHTVPCNLQLKSLRQSVIPGPSFPPTPLIAVANGAWVKIKPNLREAHACGPLPSHTSISMMRASCRQPEAQKKENQLNLWQWQGDGFFVSKQIWPTDTSVEQQRPQQPADLSEKNWCWMYLWVYHTVTVCYTVVADWHNSVQVWENTIPMVPGLSLFNLWFLKNYYGIKVYLYITTVYHLQYSLQSSIKTFNAFSYNRLFDFSQLYIIEYNRI